MQANFIEHLGRVADIAAVVGPAVIWLSGWMRRINTTVGLNKQVVKTHLPFIYERLEVHDVALNLPHPDHPSIGLVNGDAH